MRMVDPEILDNLPSLNSVNKELNFGNRGSYNPITPVSYTHLTYGALARYKTAAALEMVTEAAKKHALLAFATRMAEAAGDQLKSAEEALDEAERCV